MKDALPYLLFSIPVAIDLIVSYRRIIHDHKVVDHNTLSNWRILIMMILACVDSYISRVFIWQSLFLEMAYFWLVYDYALNLIVHYPFYFLGTTSWIDQRLNQVPGFVLLFVKIWVFMCAVGVYYHLDWVTGHINY